MGSPLPNMVRSSSRSDMSPFKAATPVQVRCGSPAAMPLPWCLRLTGQDTSLCDSLRAALRAVARCIALRRLSSWQYGFEPRRYHQRPTAADNSLRVSRLAAMAADCKSAGFAIVGQRADRSKCDSPVDCRLPPARWRQHIYFREAKMQIDPPGPPCKRAASFPEAAQHIYHTIFKRSCKSALWPRFWSFLYGTSHLENFPLRM